ncbi:MAG: HIT domain-containing protein [Candidatus Aenigmatarchaeota archaeon]
MECIFCKIVKKEIEAEIIYEDENFIAFLDINPRSKGMTLVIPKEHIKNLSENENISKELFFIAIKISEAIKKSLGALEVSIAFMPSQIEHLHLRIYPYFENEIPLIENKPKEYSKEELKKIGELIRKNIEIKKEEKIKPKIIEEKDEGKEMSKRKRDWLIA